MIWKELERELDAMKAQGLERSLREIAELEGARLTWQDKTFLNFSSNNYLGLSRHPGVIQAAKLALDEWGAGATASRLLAGHFSIHQELEERVAVWKGAARALIFPSGYHANLAVITALLGKGDIAILDRLCHASLVDGVRLSGASLRVFQHNDPADLQTVLARHSGKNRTLVVTESVFSMDGDLAPLREIVEAVSKTGAVLLVDEAHASGLWGPKGAGRIAEAGLSGNPAVIQMGTFSKALGSQGGFVCGGEALIRWMLHKARPFIYTTGLNPASCGAALQAIDLCAADDRRARAFALSDQLRTGLRGQGWTVLSATGPIVPIRVGDERRSVEVARAFLEAGIFAPAIRTPTVPKGEARIRFSVTAEHSEEDIHKVLKIAGALR